MKTTKPFFVSVIAFICILKANAQEIVFDLSLNKQDSTITYKVVNHTNSQLLIIGSITHFMPEEMKGSFCEVIYKGKNGKLRQEFLPIAKKFFQLSHNEEFITKINISQY